MNDDDKKVDTQTTEKGEGTNEDANEVAEKTGGNAQNADTKLDNKTSADNSNTKDTVEDEKIANAFGNKTEKNKGEEEKGKKANSVAQTNADGSITFKNQAELDGFIDRMFKKRVNEGAKQGTEQKASNGAQKTEENDTKSTTTEKGENNQDAEGTSENVQADSDGLMAKIALAMIDADINAKKAKKAARLVDVNNVVVDGHIDEVKLKVEIEEIISEWPELKAETSVETANKGFAFGGSQGNSNTNSDDTEISKIFGND